MLSKFSKFLLGLVFFSASLSFFIILFFAYLIFRPSAFVEKEFVRVERNNVEYLATLLCEEKIATNFQSALLSLQALKKIGIVPRIGEYRLPAGASIITAIKIFGSAKPIMHKFTIPEGLPTVAVIDRLQKNPYLTGEIQSEPEEGSLMPDTYVFSYPTSRNEIILQAKKEMEKFLSENWPKRSSSCVLKTPREALILASIVEKETASEHALVASVYFNRLKKNMRLESCPTVIYGITKGLPLKRKVFYKDLYNKHPYNTYKNFGLPPTPITNPGRLSILAVLNPINSDYLFFLLGKNGKHLFSTSYKEHLSKKKASAAQG